MRVLRLLQPIWLLRHLGALAAAAVCSFLGHWQWDRAQVTHSVQNWGYAFQWWTFAVAGSAWYARVLLDAVRKPGKAKPERRQSAPALGPRIAPRAVADGDDADDPALAAYNRRLAALHAADTASR